MVTHSGPKVLWISYSHRSSTFHQVLLYSSGQLPMHFNKATILREWDHHCIKRSVSRTIVLDDFCFEGSVVRWYTVEVNFHIWINNLKTKQKRLFHRRKSTPELQLHYQCTKILASNWLRSQAKEDISGSCPTSPFVRVSPLVSAGFGSCWAEITWKIRKANPRWMFWKITVHSFW